jgi:hypothetical protein
MSEDDNEMSRLLNDLDASLFQLIRTRSRLAEIVKRKAEDVKRD